MIGVHSVVGKSVLKGNWASIVRYHMYQWQLIIVPVALKS